jgi:hypothetical protein
VRACCGDKSSLLKPRVAMAQVPGHLPLDYWKRTGTTEKHFPNEVYQFDIEGIRRFVFFHLFFHFSFFDVLFVHFPTDLYQFDIEGFRRSVT